MCTTFFQDGLQPRGLRGALASPILGWCTLSFDPHGDFLHTCSVSLDPRMGNTWPLDLLLKQGLALLCSAIIVILKWPQETKPSYFPCFCWFCFFFFFMKEKERVALLPGQAKQEHSRLAPEELCPRPGKWWCCSMAKLCPSLWARVLQHTRLLCPPLSPGVCSNSVRWVGDAI